MPKRSNDFQRLVFQLEQLLVEAGFTITESKMVAGRTGRKREVDIAIEGSVGGHAVFIAVECRDHERKPDVTWIEELIGKYQHVPADKVIAVSRSGFTHDAVELANGTVAPRIETRSLTDALHTDWRAFFAQLRYVTTDFLIPLDQDQIPHVNVILPSWADPTALTGADLNTFCVLQPGRERGPTLPELLNMACRSDDVIRRIHQTVRPNTIRTVPLELPFPEGTRLAGQGRGSSHGRHVHDALPSGATGYSARIRIVRRCPRRIRNCRQLSRRQGAHHHGPGREERL
jgi:hypothetical protein